MNILFATLCCLCLQVVQCAKTPLHVEPFDEGYEVAHIAIIATSFSVAGALALVVLVSLAVRRKASLANMLLVMVFAAVIVVGMVSWIITYAKMRDEMQEKVQSLIILAGDGVDLAILRSLESGVALGEVYKKMNAFQMTSMNESFPAPAVGLHVLRSSQRGRDAAITGVYYGTKWGYTLGGWPNPRNDSEFIMFYGYPQSAPLSDVQHFSCRGWDYADAGCDAVNCSTSARLNCGETCLIYNTTNCYSQHNTSRIIYYPTRWGAPLPSQEVNATFVYEPRGRPWYLDGMAADGEPVWTAPYVFADKSFDLPMEEIGFSYEFAVKNSVTGEAEGVFAVDYALGSLHIVLLDLLPTEHSAILMCDLNGVLFASSSFASDIAIPNVDADGNIEWGVANVFTHPRSEIRDVFHDIRRVVGSLNEASQLRRLIQLPDSTILLSPLNMTGLSLLIVVEVPHEDILEAVNDASTLSLAVVMVISVVLAGLVSGLIYVLVSKLENLSQDMQNVAWMKVEGTAVSEADSIVSEIHSMQQSFSLLVKNMMEYRQYLPQSLLVASDEDEPDSSETSTSHSQAKNSSPHMNIRSKLRAQQQLFDSGLNDRNLSVMCCNWRGTHERLSSAKKGGTMQKFTDAYRKYLEAVMQTSKQMRGVIDYFNGDRVRVTFNAVMPAAQHTRRSAECASAIRGTCEARGEGTVACGVASGASMCGNVGCTGMKKFIVFGKAVTAAHTLMRLAAIMSESIVVEGAAVEAVKHFFIMKRLRKLTLPNSEKPSLVCSVVSVIALLTDEERMYEMEAAHKNPYADYNNAVRLMYDGDYAAALECTRKSTKAVAENELSALKERILACQRAGEPEASMVL